MIRHRVIGLVGYKGVGKDTAATAMISKGFVKESFASPLKDVVAHIFSWPRELVEGETKSSREWREKPDPYWSNAFGQEIKPRDILQRFGTESMRDVFHNDIWIHSLIKRIENLHTYSIVITDVRFQNEVEAVRKIGGILIRICRGPEPEWYRTAEQACRGNQQALTEMQLVYKIHRSEWDWIGSEFDHVIENNTTVEEFQQKILRVIDTVRGNMLL